MRLLLGILAFGIWSFGSGYWYVCKIKGHCWGDDLRPVKIVNEGMAPKIEGEPAVESNGASEMATVDGDDGSDTEALSESEGDFAEEVEASRESDPNVGYAADLPEVLQSPHAILFAYAKPIISKQGDTDSYIQALQVHLNSNPQARIRIAGYTDDTAAKWKNKELSMKRAEAIASLLEAEGISRDKMDLEAMGEANPVATNETPAGRRLNRRAEITVFNP